MRLGGTVRTGIDGAGSFAGAGRVRRRQTGTEAIVAAPAQALAQRHAARLTFRHAGPLPPYSFVGLNIGWQRAAPARPGGMPDPFSAAPAVGGAARSLQHARSLRA